MLEIKRLQISREKEAIIKKIIPVLQREGCKLAVIFGFFVEPGEFRDIDIKVALQGSQAHSNADCMYLSQVLEKEMGFKFDIVGPAVPNILLRSVIDGIDFRPLIEVFYRERFNVKGHQ